MDDIERRVIALEGQGKVIERLEVQLGTLGEKVDKLLSATGSFEVFRSMQSGTTDEIQKLEGQVVALSDEVNMLSRDLLSKWSMARGIIIAGTLFFALLQGMLAMMWTDVVNRVESDHEKVMEIQHKHELEERLTSPGG